MRPSTLAPAALLVAELPAGRRPLILHHLLQLAPNDRRLRFGTAANDAALRRYVGALDFDRDALFGAFDAVGCLTGFAHLAFGGAEAELGLSVLPGARGRGTATRLVERAIRHAQARRQTEIVMHFLPENSALARLAAAAGMHLEGGQQESMARLRLTAPPPAAFWAEAIDAVLGNLDLSFRLAQPSA